MLLHNYMLFMRLNRIPSRAFGNRMFANLKSHEGEPALKTHATFVFPSNCSVPLRQPEGDAPTEMGRLHESHEAPSLQRRAVLIRSGER